VQEIGFDWGTCPGQLAHVRESFFSHQKSYLFLCFCPKNGVAKNFETIFCGYHGPGAPILRFGNSGVDTTAPGAPILRFGNSGHSKLLAVHLQLFRAPDYILAALVEYE
jgi:hypothetical protein